MPPKTKTQEQKRWRRIDRVAATCLYCGNTFEQDAPNQKYCTPSHKQLAYLERKRSD